jgi:hypothetical protein
MQEAERKNTTAKPPQGWSEYQFQRMRRAAESERREPGRFNPALTNHAIDKILRLAVARSRGKRRFRKRPFFPTLSKSSYDNLPLDRCFNWHSALSTKIRIFQARRSRQKRIA